MMMRKTYRWNILNHSFFYIGTRNKHWTVKIYPKMTQIRQIFFGYWRSCIVTYIFKGILHMQIALGPLIVSSVQVTKKIYQY